MSKVTFLENKQIQTNILAVQALLKKLKLDALYLSSSDIFLNEYVPLEDNHRYYVTNFTGSTAEVLVPSNGRVMLFVDGRYFEQADLEVDPLLVEVVKVEMNLGLRNSVIERIKTNRINSLAIEGDRTDLNLAHVFESKTKVHYFNRAELSEVIDFKTTNFNKLILEVDKGLSGETTSERLKRILRPGEAIYITALDSIAWLTNLRRYEMPNQSTFKARALATYDRVYLLMEQLEGEIKNPDIEIYIGSFSKLSDFINDIILVNNLVENNSFELSKIIYSDASINASDFAILKNIFGLGKLENWKDGLVPFHSLKNEFELNSMKSSFDRADKAIFKTISWVKEQVKNNKKITELDYYHQCDHFYKEEGALEQSFKTIAAFGTNSSIIHFSNPTQEVIGKKDELALLDSGGYFESGYATDTTRTFLTGGVASKKQKEIYTLVLKSILHAMNAIFPENVFGATIDGVTRQSMFKYGYNYNHGTGHGVGINVHEGGFRISPNSTIPLRVNTVGSIEPGIYIPGFGGVRLENIVIVRKHPTLTGMCYFESLVYVGFDHELIETNLLTLEEKNWLDIYERECAKRGRSFIA